MVILEEKLALLRYRVSPDAHITVDKKHCISCQNRACTYVCPAACYTEADDGQILFAYEGCLECGSCRIVCDQEAIDWRYPKGGYGVGYRFV